jgi:hypothetical protein
MYVGKRAYTSLKKLQLKNVPPNHEDPRLEYK